MEPKNLVDARNAWPSRDLVTADVKRFIGNSSFFVGRSQTIARRAE